MRVRRDWRYVLNRAWSIKLALLSAVFGAIAATLPLFSSVVSPALFGALSMVAAIATAVVRLLDQPGMDRRKEDVPVTPDRRKEE